MINRRGILLGLASALAAPAIVHAGNLMPVKTLKPEGYRIVLWGFDQIGKSVSETLWMGAAPSSPAHRAAWIAETTNLRMVSKIVATNPWQGYANLAITSPV